MKKLIRFPRQSWLRALLLLAACWLLAFLGPLSYLVIPALPVVLRRVWCQRARLALALVLVLNPVSGFFIAGVAAYVNGAPVLRSRTLPDLESYNPDPTNRCPRSSGAGPVEASDWLSIATRNSGVLLMCRCFGPASLEYDGPYPTKQQALALCDNALLSPVDQFFKGRVLADGTMVRLPPAVVSGLAGLVALQDDAPTPIHAKLYQDRCVIIRLSRRSGPAATAADFGTDILVLIDKRSQRPFAFYPLKGDTLPRKPPVGYLE